MKISENGLDLIEQFEGFRSHAYKCPAGIWTIGIGSTHYEDGTEVHGADAPISKERAYEILKYEIDNHYGKMVNTYLKASTTQNQFDALVSFAYNLGTGALKRSTLMKYHNHRETENASNEFGKWNKAGHIVLNGLKRRRKAERKLYLA